MPDGSDCERGASFSFHVLCVAHETFFSWLPGSRRRAEQRARDSVRRMAEGQFDQVNAEIDAWIANQGCDPPCTPRVVRRPAVPPPRFQTTWYRTMVQVTARLEASADADCLAPERRAELPPQDARQERG